MYGFQIITAGREKSSSSKLPSPSDGIGGITKENPRPV